MDQRVWKVVDLSEHGLASLSMKSLEFMGWYGLCVQGSFHMTGHIFHVTNHSLG